MERSKAILSEGAGGMTARRGWTWREPEVSEEAARVGAVGASPGETDDPETVAADPEGGTGMTRHYAYMDGREVEADSAVAFFEALRGGEPLAPATLARYLDLIRSRAALGFGLRVDIGRPDEDIAARCRRALSSLLSHGWVRPVPAAGRGLQRLARQPD